MAEAELSIQAHSNMRATVRRDDEERCRDRFDLSPVLKGGDFFPKSEDEVPALSFNISDFPRSRIGKLAIPETPSGF